MTRSLRRLGVVLGLTVLVTGAAVPATAIEKVQPLKLEKIMEIRQLLEQSLRLQRQALEEVPDREVARQTVFQAYVPLRAAHARMVIHMSHRKIQFPTYDLNYKQVADARERVLAARTALGYNLNHQIRGETAEQIAVRSLAESIRLTQLVIATGF